MAVSVASSFLVLITMIMAGVVAGQGWDSAFATFYGDMTGAETMGGACGYGDLVQQGYGLQTAALSTALFNNGQACGACFELQCYNSPQWCSPGSTIQITATNFCPPNWAKPSNDGGWCNPPRKHFDLSMPMFVKLVKDFHADIVPVQFRRVPCVKKGGVRFLMQGNRYWVLVLVYNVAAAGEVTGVAVKGLGRWDLMSRNWGQNWQTGVQLSGQALSFRVTTSDGKMIQFYSVVPQDWQFGQTFQSPQNF